MSSQDYEKARDLIEDAGGGDFEGSKPESLVAKAESALGLKFPPSYKQFLIEMGCGDINGFEVYGIIDDNFENSSIPNGIWMTLKQRNAIGLDHKYVIVGEGGDGTLNVIDTGETIEAENPVIRLSIDGKLSQRMNDSFGSYLLEQVESVL